MGTWNKKRVFLVITISMCYGTWFDFLDAANGIGDAMGGNMIYQTWNIIGHCIPGLFMLIWFPRRFELFIAGVLISSVIMDSPIWGVMKIDGHHQMLWDPAPTSSVLNWMVYYYNPVGLYTVWNWFHGQPTAALMFWGVVARMVAAFLLIWIQDRQESQGKEFKLRNLMK